MRSQDTRDRQASSRLGIPLADYVRHRLAGRKRCPRCRAWLALDAFSPNPAHRSGLHSHCRACSRVMGREVYPRTARAKNRNTTEDSPDGTDARNRGR